MGASEQFHDVLTGAPQAPFKLDPCSCRTVALEDEFNHFNIAKIAASLEKAGVLVNTGAHGQREGLGLHWEIWMLVQGGLTPHEALRCATADGAVSLGMNRYIGTLQPANSPTSSSSTPTLSKTSASPRRSSGPWSTDGSATPRR